VKKLTYWYIWLERLLISVADGVLTNMAMTTEEAGRRGGLAVKKKYGPSFYSEIGRKGGLATKKNYGPDFYSKIGESGGEAVKEKHGPSFYSEIGKKGGKSRNRKDRRD